MELYSIIQSFFGPVPLHTSSSDEALKPRATDAEMRAQIESDLTDAMNALPVSTDKFGKATKGAARTFDKVLSQYGRAADMAKLIIFW